jgi:hypothetical protein
LGEHNTSDSNDCADLAAVKRIRRHMVYNLALLELEQVSTS